MKKILAISYYFPPCNIVSAQRAGSFADNFARHGLWPVVATRHWTGSENNTQGWESENLSPPEITEHNTHSLIRMPYAAQLDGWVERLLTAKRSGKLALYFSLYARGILNPKCNAHAAFSGFLRAYMRETDVDYVLATAFPMNTIRLGSELASEFGKPFIADFRDLWDNRLMSDGYRADRTAAIQNRLYEYYLRRWLRNARLVTSVTESIADKVKMLAPQAEGLVVTNGYEEDLFAVERERHRPPSDKFIFSVIGTLEAGLDLSVMLDGLTTFLKGKDLKSIELNFIGSRVAPEVADRLADRLPKECTRITERTPRRKAVEEMLRSHVLFHAGWRGFRGMASGKLFEYLGAHRNVLIAPGDADVMESLVKETGAGRIANTPEDFLRVMNEWFDEWKAHGELAYGGDAAKIRVYSRENQAAILAEAILRL